MLSFAYSYTDLAPGLLIGGTFEAAAHDTLALNLNGGIMPVPHH